MTGKKAIQKILEQSVQDIDKIHSKIIDYMDTTIEEFDLLSHIISNVRQNLSFLEIDLSCEIRMINEKSKFEKQYKSASNKVGNLKLNFLQFSYFGYSKKKKEIENLIKNRL